MEQRIQPSRTFNTTDESSAVKFYKFARHSLRAEFLHHEQELKLQYQVRRLVRRSLNIGGSILTIQFIFFFIEYLLSYFLAEDFSQKHQAAIIRGMMVLMAMAFWVLQAVCFPQAPELVEDYFYFDVWQLGHKFVEQFMKWSLRDLTIASLAATAGFLPIEASFGILLEETIWAFGLTALAVICETISDCVKARRQEGTSPPSSRAYTRIIDGHSTPTPSTCQIVVDTLAEIPCSGALAVGWIWNKVLTDAFFAWKSFYKAGPFLTFLALAVYAKLITRIVVTLVRTLSTWKKEEEEQTHGTFNVWQKAALPVVIKSSSFVFAFSIIQAVTFGYETIMMECSEKRPCTYQMKFLYAIVISVMASLGILFLRSLLEQERPVGSPVLKCIIGNIDQGTITWEEFNHVKVGRLATFIELLNNTMSLMIGIVWSGFFVSLAKPMNDANGFGCTPEMGMALSTGIMCIAYWGLVIPVYHETRNAVRTLAQSQVEALARIMHDATANDESLCAEDKNHRRLLPDLVERLEGMVMGAKPVFGPEHLNSVKTRLIAHYKEKV
jgi:hypothetical protein